MKIVTTERFDREFRRLGEQLRHRAEEQLERLAENPSHPSLRLKRMAGQAGLWELRVTQSYRITFEWSGQDVTLRRIGTHKVLDQP